MDKRICCTNKNAINEYNQIKKKKKIMKKYLKNLLVP